jgi:streptogramin lyase
MTRFAQSRRYWLVLSVLCVFGVVAGAAIAIGSAGAGPPSARLVEAPLSANTGSNGGGYMSTLDPGSSAVVFPAAISGFQGQIGDIAVDKSGVLWIVGTGSDEEFYLARYGPNAAELKRYALPVGDVAARARLEFTDQDQLVIATGKNLLVVNPDSFQYKDIDLAGSPSSGAVMELRVSGGSAFLSRYAQNSISEVDLDSGKSIEHAVPSSFVNFDDFQVTQSKIWIIKTGDTAGGQPSAIGSLDRATGKFEVVSTKVRSAGLRGDDLFAVTWDPDAVVRVTGSGTEAIPAAGLSDFVGPGLGVEKELLADSGGFVWITDLSRNSVARLDPDSGKATVYSLPLFGVDISTVSCPPPGCGDAGTVPVSTNVTDVAVSPTGDFYFAENTLNRIGLIPAH